MGIQGHPNEEAVAGEMQFSLHNIISGAVLIIGEVGKHSQSGPMVRPTRNCCVLLFYGYYYLSQIYSIAA